jgi:hypothetical protein
MSLNERAGPLWDDLRHVIRRHIESGHDEIDTINRLLRKRRVRLEPALTLQIPKDGLRIGEENWSIDHLWTLLHPTQIVPHEPKKPTGAIALLRWADRDILIDGRRRINHWKRHNLLGPHRVLVVQRDKTQ